MFEYYRIDTLINQPSSNWVSLGITIIGTLFGFLGAYYLTRITENKQKKKEKQQKIELYIDRLKYLTQLIDKCLELANNQIDRFGELSKNLSDDPIEQHLLKLIGSNDMLRLQKMDTEEVFHAYHLIMPDNSDKMKDYKSIYSSIDFIYLRIIQVIDSNEKHMGFKHQDHIQIKETIEKLATEMVKWIKLIESYDNFNSFLAYHFLVKHHKQYMQLTNEIAHLGNFESDFLIEFGDELRKNFDKEIFFSDLYTLVSQAISRFNHLKSNTTIFATELSEIKSIMKEPIDRLVTINEKIKSHISSK